ncbi:MAG: hypothetical protein H0W08_26655 [Acidobacteria bacterium]|nr:hypothetical protein [Acidobacteriota bacterium]
MSADRSHDEYVTLRGHTGRVFTATFSPDSSRVLTASEDGTARVWSVAGAAEVLTLKGHDGYVMSATFSLDGKRGGHDRRRSHGSHLGHRGGGSKYRQALRSGYGSPCNVSS